VLCEGIVKRMHIDNLLGIECNVKDSYVDTNDFDMYIPTNKIEGSENIEIIQEESVVVNETQKTHGSP
jgi:hypothetical protein